MTKILLRLIGGLLVLVLCLSRPAGAEEYAEPGIVPPRLGVVEGAVNFWRPDSEGWVAAQLNAALASGDAIRTGGGGTAEIQVGPRDFVRLTANTMVTVTRHEAGMMQFRVGSGTASFDLRSVEPGRLIEIDAPNAALMVGGAGYYRLDVQGEASRFTVRRGGKATINLADGRSRNIAAGEELAVRGTDQPAIEARPAPSADTWDRWNDARSDYYAAAASNRYVPADAYGAADLDRSGSWREAGDYGWVWVPDVLPGWAPYSDGSWQWDPVYGWTWVDTAPWGWTTSHYGRWVFIDGYWAWAPGSRRVRWAYAPAVVKFARVPGGLNWTVPGWGEPLAPWWGKPGIKRMLPPYGDHPIRHPHHHSASVPVVRSGGPEPRHPTVTVPTPNVIQPMPNVTAPAPMRAIEPRVGRERERQHSPEFRPDRPREYPGDHGRHPFRKEKD